MTMNPSTVSLAGSGVGTIGCRVGARTGGAAGWPLNSFPAQLSALLTAEAYPHPVETVTLIETHVSWVLLAGDFAYKIKRPVCYPFVDMRTLDQRHFLCREELRLNRRFAPELYLDVVCITQRGEVVRIGGLGVVLEHAVRMRKFDRSEELDRLLVHCAIEPEDLAELGRSLAKIHRDLPQVGEGAAFGLFRAVRDSVLQNVEQFRTLSARVGLAVDPEALRRSFNVRLQQALILIDARRASGSVRECHGDLHCRNVVRAEGRLVAFDGLEFQPAFRWIDVAEEIAFLYMDLGRWGAHAHAAAFLNGYLSESGDYEAASLVRLYGAHRALVRAKVAAIEAASASSEEREPARLEHSAYVASARDLLSPQRPALILMTGFSGSGKTWLAQRLAPQMGAIHVRSDIERKRLAGMGALDSSASGVDQGLYAPDLNDRTYERLVSCAEDILAGGFCAIVDATFQRRADRDRLSGLASALGISLVVVRCRAPQVTLQARILQRQKRADDASETNLEVLERQQAGFEAIDPGESLTVIDADTTVEGVVATTLAALRSAGVQRISRCS